MDVLPLLATYLVVLEGYIHTIAVYFYAYRPIFSGKNTAFSTILPCVLHQNVLHLAPKRTAFSTKTQAILHQNAPHLAANHPKSGANGGFFK